MKKGLLALALCLAVLTGCSSMLNRSYLSVQTHSPLSGGNVSASSLRAESYQDLVNAVLYLVTQGLEQGEIELHNYSGDVGVALDQACLEVASEDPLGAYCVDYIKSEYTKIISYYEATISITYRRTQAQVKQIVSVTGTSAIRGELREALGSFSPESVLRVSSFSEDEASILDLVRQAYCGTPEAALGLPEISVALYPATGGQQRIVEILLTYSDEREVLLQKQADLLAAADAAADELRDTPPDELPQALFHRLRAATLVEGENGPSGSAYGLLVDGQTDCLGAALSWQLLGGRLGLESALVQGERAGGLWYWNMIRVGEVWLHVDVTAPDGLMRTGEEMNEAGYLWEVAVQPVQGG